MQQILHHFRLHPVIHKEVAAGHHIEFSRSGSLTQLYQQPLKPLDALLRGVEGIQPDWRGVRGQWSLIVAAPQLDQIRKALFHFAELMNPKPEEEGRHAQAHAKARPINRGLPA